MEKNKPLLFYIAFLNSLVGIFFAEAVILSKTSSIVFWTMSFAFGAVFNFIVDENEERINCKRWSAIKAAGTGLFLGGLVAWIIEIIHGNTTSWIQGYWLEGLAIFTNIFLFFLGAVVYSICAQIKGTWYVIRKWI